MHGPSSKYKTQIKNLHWINHISLHTKYHWRTISSLLLSGSTNGKKNFRYRNSLLQHACISKLFGLTIFHHISWSCNLLILGCSPFVEQSRISNFQILHTLKIHLRLIFSHVVSCFRLRLWVLSKLFYLF